MVCENVGEWEGEDVKVDIVRFLSTPPPLPAEGEGGELPEGTGLVRVGVAVNEGDDVDDLDSMEEKIAVLARETLELLELKGVREGVGEKGVEKVALEDVLVEGVGEGVEPVTTVGETVGDWVGVRVGIREEVGLGKEEGELELLGVKVPTRTELGVGEVEGVDLAVGLPEATAGVGEERKLRVPPEKEGGWDPLETGVRLEKNEGDRVEEWLGEEEWVEVRVRRGGVMEGEGELDTVPVRVVDRLWVDATVDVSEGWLCGLTEDTGVDVDVGL